MRIRSTADEVQGNVCYRAADVCHREIDAEEFWATRADQVNGFGPDIYPAIPREGRRGGIEPVGNNDSVRFGHSVGMLDDTAVGRRAMSGGCEKRERGAGDGC